MVLSHRLHRWPPLPLGQHPLPGPGHHPLHRHLQHPDHASVHLLYAYHLLQPASEAFHEKLLDGLRDRDLLHLILLMHPDHLPDSDRAAGVLSLCEEVLRG